MTQGHNSTEDQACYTSRVDRIPEPYRIGEILSLEPAEKRYSKRHRHQEDQNKYPLRCHQLVVITAASIVVPLSSKWITFGFHCLEGRMSSVLTSSLPPNVLAYGRQETSAVLATKIATYCKNRDRHRPAARAAPC